MKFGIMKKKRITIQNKKQVDLFTEYVNTFLKIKQEASGYPHWVKSDSDQD